MKATSLFLAPVLGLTLLLSPARAEDPATTNLQEVQAIIGELSKLAAGHTAKKEGAPDLSGVLNELSKLAATATPGATKEEQAQESQLISFIKSLLAMVPQVPEEAVEPAGNPATPAAVTTAAGSVNVKSVQGATGVQGSAGLTTGSLGTTPRLTEAEWRARFPVRETGR